MADEARAQGNAAYSAAVTDTINLAPTNRVLYSYASLPSKPLHFHSPLLSSDLDKSAMADGARAQGNAAVTDIINLAHTNHVLCSYASLNRYFNAKSYSGHGAAYQRRLQRESIRRRSPIERCRRAPSAMRPRVLNSGPNSRRTKFTTTPFRIYYSMETLSAEEYHRVGMAFATAGDFISAVRAFGRGTYMYPNNSALRYACTLCVQCLPGTRVIGVGDGRLRRGPTMYNGVDAPVKPAAMLHFYNAENCMRRQDYSNARRFYAEALKIDKDNRILLLGFRMSILLWYQDCERFQLYRRDVRNL